VALVTAGCSSTGITTSGAGAPPPVVTPGPVVSGLGSPKTPIQHLVVIFGENISYDHYFATYPKVGYNAADPLDSNEIDLSNFPATATAPANNNLAAPLNPSTWAVIAAPTLLTANPNGPTGSGAAFNGGNAVNPFLFWPSQAATADQNHSPKPEQVAYDNGKMDEFPGSTGTTAAVPLAGSTGDSAADLAKGQVMGYFDGATVTAL